MLYVESNKIHSIGGEGNTASNTLTIPFDRKGPKVQLSASISSDLVTNTSRSQLTSNAPVTVFVKFTEVRKLLVGVSKSS